jgi:hypothetical protein
VTKSNEKKSQQQPAKSKGKAKTKAVKRVHAKGNPGQGGAQPGAGRPRIPIPYDLIEELCHLHPSEEEIAGFCKINRCTLEEWKKDPLYLAAVERGRSNGKLNLRRRQLKKAEEGDGTMLVWLGKNMLGQADKAEVKHSHVQIVVQRLSDESPA